MPQTPTLYDLIKNTLEMDCRCRSLDDADDYKAVLEAIVQHLKDPIRDLVREAVDCAVVCELDPKERAKYASDIVREAFLSMEE